MLVLKIRSYNQWTYDIYFKSIETLFKWQYYELKIEYSSFMNYFTINTFLIIIINKYSIKL